MLDIMILEAIWGFARLMARHAATHLSGQSVELIDTLAYMALRIPDTLL